MTVAIVMGALLVALNGYAVVLIHVRSSLFGVPLYRPMLTNVLLSALPVVVAGALVAGLFVGGAVTREFGISGEIVTLVLDLFVAATTIVWLLLFPNSIYLITELNFSHRTERDPVPLWFDIIATLTLSVSGIANGVTSLAVIHTVTESLIDPHSAGTIASFGSWVFAAAVIVLGSFGVYLGRFVRVNSWDVKHPLAFAQQLATHFAVPFNRKTGALFVLTYSVFFGILYALAFIPLRAELPL